MNKTSLKCVQVLFLVCASSMIAGCASFDSRARTTRVMEPYGYGVIQHPVIGELDVSAERIKATFTNVVKGQIQSTEHREVERSKASAVSQALASINADILIEPIYDIKRKYDGNDTTITVSVTGYPASYKEFRSATSDDVRLLEQTHRFAVMQRAEIKQAEQEQVQKSALGYLIGLIIIFAGAAAL